MKNTQAIATLSLALVAGGAEAAYPVLENAQLNWAIESGLGYETNAYNAPDHSYIDYYADPTGATIVNPNEQAGFFIPLKVQAAMSSPLNERTDLVADYRFSGQFHPDSALQDANSTMHKVNVGGDFRLGKGGKKGKAHAGVFVHSRDKVYVDSDSGEPKVSAAGINVSDRYTFTSYGLEGDYERKMTRADSVGVKAVYEELDYSDPVVWSQYDHTYTMYGVYWEHRFTKPTKLTLEIDNEVRDYSDRHAYNADGSLFASNPVLKYTYMTYQVGLRHRFDDRTVAYFDYELEQRSDNHVGYNDRDQTTYKVRVIHDLNEKVRLRGKLAYIERDYANAFNFEDPAQGVKSSSGIDLQLRSEYMWNEHKTYYVELDHRSRDNTDDRYQYTNTAIMLGARWEY